MSKIIFFNYISEVKLKARRQVRDMYQESMDQEEIIFLQKKYRKDHAAFIQAFRGIFLFFLLIPGAGGIFMEGYHRRYHPENYKPQELQDAYFYLFYVKITLIILILIVLGGWTVYHRTLHQLKRDMKQGLKNVEQTQITRKTHFKGTDSYYFYLKTKKRLSIEVSAEDFNKFVVGDEINIEYAPRSLVYFGYF